ncbi:hypothetical protein [Nocardioides daejeonensis]|uniref:hypothetical protein n=1 Tax=Nocardioides daejeonensis TaxID=1046556 RepID=UPI000D74BD92|nr:hypothetical protein [Nocardioides daejeonensis]
MSRRGAQRARTISGSAGLAGNAPPVRRLAAVLILTLLFGLGACSKSAEEKRADYCAAVKDASTGLTRTADEGGASAFLKALPVLEELAEQAPSDLKDEWQTYLGALRNLRDVLAEAKVTPEELSDGVPKRLSEEERARVLGAVRNARSPQTQAAAQGITQQALDVCRTQIL